MVKVNVKTYADTLKRSYKTKLPLFIYGPPGIGKSEIPHQVFKSIAKVKGLEFVEWNKITKEEKEAIFDNKDRSGVQSLNNVGTKQGFVLRGNSSI